MKMPNAAFALLAALTLSACGRLDYEPLDAFSLLRGNDLFESGRVHEAMARYLPLANRGDPVALYNMGNAFLLVGEKDAGLSYLGKAASSPAEADRSALAKVAADAWYNLGIARYGESLYEEAAACFRRSVELSSGIAGAGSDDAALAYELALRASRQSAATGARERGAAKQGDGGDQARFDLARRADTGFFVPGTDEAPSGTDH